MINPKITGNYISLNPLVTTRGVELPMDWALLFGRDAPLELEIGFGLGDFLVKSARRFPERNFIGLEAGWPMVKRALRKVAIAGVTNVRLILSDARTAVDFFFNERSISKAYSLFPCPWPKQRHERHRLFSKEFLMSLNVKMADEGSLLIVTDHREYMEWLQGQIPGTGFNAQTDTVPPSFGTKYERKWQSSGRDSFYRIRLNKICHLSLTRRKDETLISRIANNFNPRGISLTGNRGVFTIEPKDFLFDPLQSRGMMRVVVAEDSLTQDIWIEIVLRTKGWLIKPAKGSSFIPTKGVQAALDHVKLLAEASAESIIDASQTDLP
jgi:tRNA (guanine-N7-)-methyltransferase